MTNERTGGRTTAEEARRFYQQQGQGVVGQGGVEQGGPAAGETVVRAGGSHPGAQPHPDPQYHAWREAQISAYDRDYDAFRGSHVGDPSHAFGTWRTTRQSQRDALRQVSEHMEVVGSDGAHVGTVDKVRGDEIVLTRGDAAAGGMHHRIPSAWIRGVGAKVMLDRPGDRARREWMADPNDADRSLALGEKPSQGSAGPHILDRSFSGTYEK